MLVVLAIVALLGAVLLPAVLQRLQQARTSALAATLDAIADAIVEFRVSVGRYPSQLVYLTDTPAAGWTDACARPLPAVLRRRWSGPYLQEAIDTSGVPVADATVQNILQRLTAGTDTLLQLTVLRVDQSVATDLQEAVEADNNFNAGTVLWTATSGGQGTMQYRLAIRGC